MSSILSLFPIENVFICLKEIFSEVGCGIIYIDKLGWGVLPERVAGSHTRAALARWGDGNRLRLSGNAGILLVLEGK